MMRIAAIVALVAVGPLADQEIADQRARFERGQAEQRTYERQSLMRSGLPALEPGVQVRQVALSDPYGFLPTPALHFERARSGEVVLRIMGFGVPTKTISLDATAWERLRQKEAGVFVRRVYKPWKEYGPDNPPPPPPPICHGWGALIGSGGGGEVRTTSWGACGSSEPDAKLAYVQEMMTIALATRPDCEDRGDPFWTLQTCFTPAPKEAS